MVRRSGNPGVENNPQRADHPARHLKLGRNGIEPATRHSTTVVPGRAARG